MAFIAPNVHDFMWAADPLYKQCPKLQMESSLCLYRTEHDPKQDTCGHAGHAAVMYSLLKKTFGAYPINNTLLCMGEMGRSIP